MRSTQRPVRRHRYCPHREHNPAAGGSHSDRFDRRCIESIGDTKSNDLSQVVAQIDVAQSNPMIEALRRKVRHRCLLLHTLDTFVVLEKHVAKYIKDYNRLIPREGLGGRTPDEAFFGRESARLKVPEQKSSSSGFRLRN